MPNTDRLQPDFGQNPKPEDTGSEQSDNNYAKLSLSLGKDISSLQSGLRTDFDQKISDLTDLLARFKALVGAGKGGAANDSSITDTYVITAPNKHNGDKLNDTGTNPDERSIKIGTLESGISSSQEDSVPLLTKKVANDTPAQNTLTSFSETARFESGLYKLNCQLYRFRLELDQEMEFREEPLHLHFRQQSELSMMLQKISVRSGEKNSD